MNADIQTKISLHLRQQYSGIWDEAQIQEHITHHVGTDQSVYWVNRVKPLCPDGGKILDVGSGYGSFVLSSRQRGYEAFGVEIEDFEHQVAKERAAAHLLPADTFRQGSALSLPFPDENFDCVTFWNVIEHIPDAEKALQEASRVLKPGGSLFLIAPNYAAFRREAHYHVPWFPYFPKAVARLYLKVLGKNPRFLDENIFYVTHTQLRSILTSHGLSITDDLLNRFREGGQAGRPGLARAISILKRLGTTRILEYVIRLKSMNPWQHSIDFVAKKPVR